MTDHNTIIVYGFKFTSIKVFGVFRSFIFRSNDIQYEWQLEDTFICIYSYCTHKIPQRICIPGTYDTNLHIFGYVSITELAFDQAKNKTTNLKMDISKDSSKAHQLILCIVIFSLNIKNSIFPLYIISKLE